MADMVTWLGENHSAHRAELDELLRIPSISTDPERAVDVRACAEWVRARLSKAGVPTVELIETARHPVVWGEWHGAPGKPTVLVYGHYDVQPVDPLDLWQTDPFVPTVRDDKIYARGVSDMKTNLLTIIQGVEAAAQATGVPPVNLTFFFEGEEEIGSPSAEATLQANRARLVADLVLSGDGGQVSPTQPRLTVAYKGITGLQIDLRTGSTDLHSGGYGAAIPNAALAIAQLASSFHGPDGRVLVKGFYDDVIDLSDADKAEIAAVAQTDDALLAEAGAYATWGESGYTAAERRGARPTIDVNGIWSGFQGAGSKTVTPCEAHLKVTARLVANQENTKIAELIRQHAITHAPAGCKVSFGESEHGSAPYMAERGFLGETIATSVLTETYGSPPQIARAGGSVPILSLFKRIVGIDTVTIGFGLPGSNAHAPNEWYLESQFDLARAIYGRFFSAF
jgi:acetylornithine deacetylase/succinyl-diaminopimelate desuccinylase-like protein